MTAETLVSYIFGELISIFFVLLLVKKTKKLSIIIADKTDIIPHLSREMQNNLSAK